MARLFPTPAIGSITSEHARLYRALRKIPGDQTLAWMSLPLTEEWRPDWMLVHEDRVCYLLVVSPLSLQADLFGNHSRETPEAVATRENDRLLDFLRSCEISGSPVYGAVVFPNISQTDLEAIQKRLPQLDVVLWGAEMVSADTIKKALQKTPSSSVLPVLLIQRIREKICPESLIPSALTAKPKRNRRTDLHPTHTPILLDLDQEYLAKEDLIIPPEQDALVASERTSIVTGVAGSGKSLVILYRIMLYERMNPGRRILAITHNIPLCNELQSRLEKIHPKTQARWLRFYQFCGSLNPQWRDTLDDWKKEDLLNQLRGPMPELDHLPVEFVASEIDWIRDQGFADEADYLSTARLGRRRPLSRNQRSAMLRLLTSYREHLEAHQQNDWPGIAEGVWRDVVAGRICLPVYDYIFVDEAQFFAPVWFKIILRCLDPAGGRLFIAADPTQGFLKRRHSWQAVGIQARGRIDRLKKAYRNCREILEFAAAFYRNRLPDEDEEINLPEAIDLEGLPVGKAPVFLESKSRQDEPQLVAREILEALRKGGHPGNYLVLFNGRNDVDDFIALLNRMHGSTLAINAKSEDKSRQDRVRVTTLNAATGLESAVVFLCGIEALLEREQALGMDAADQLELVRDNTRQIYMALTRASRRVFIVYRAEKTRKILCAESADAICNRLALAAS